MRDALVVTSDGWASFVKTNFSKLHRLNVITSSTVHDPEHEPLAVDERLVQHPGRTIKDLEEIAKMAEQMRASGSKENTDAPSSIACKHHLR